MTLDRLTLRLTTHDASTLDSYSIARTKYSRDIVWIVDIFEEKMEIKLVLFQNAPQSLYATDSTVCLRINRNRFIEAEPVVRLLHHSLLLLFNTFLIISLDMIDVRNLLQPLYQAPEMVGMTNKNGDNPLKE